VSVNTNAGEIFSRPYWLVQCCDRRLSSSVCL